MKKRFLSIGDYSKKVGVSPEFLKFYEKKGLVSPAWKDDRSYRYYADYQVTHFMEYQQLSRMGVSLEDAKGIQEHASLEERLNIYKKACEEKRQELEQMELFLEQIEDTSFAIENIANNRGWRIAEVPVSYFVYPKSFEHKESVKNPVWKDNFSMNITQYVKLKDRNCDRLEEGNFERLWGAVQPFSNIIYKEASNNPNNEIMVVGGVKCFVYEHAIPTDYDESGKLSDKVWDLSEPLKILKDNGMKNKGVVWQKRLCVSHEVDGEFLQVQTTIPIE
ncbi:DNA-binding transcriptional regulator, MerR family [Pseudobutyrivibrio sp. 49]|uniref:MerR family transcriptional regulator n=1 Tax=Pseudobutyrivibrio sp. 49 TaxID=1855344 RepID=UPI00087E3BDA|nr:MerR family transcriptional regulator [Pseudobutyrivibrio sp. 49]SDH87875.1 DNA-binding transcriptional regulator, MerR family [Pseudobutyrivibrio sp. 49]